MRDDLAEIGVVIDCSGSMQPLISDTIGGFNKFIEDQKALPGDANISVTLFNTQTWPHMKHVPIAKSVSLDLGNYHPNGSTALYDAISITIKDMGERLAAMNEDARPSKVILVIMTDGEENASKFTTLAEVSEMLKHQQEIYSWEVIFIGQGLDVQAVHAQAAAFNVPADNAMAFAANSSGTEELYSAVNSRVTQRRNG